jgi:hypothetical protein
MIRGSYSPSSSTKGASSAVTTWGAGYLADVEAGRLTSEEMIESYYRLVFEKSGSFKAAARELGVDWRTVQRYIRQQAERRRSKTEEQEDSG